MFLFKVKLQGSGDCFTLSDTGSCAHVPILSGISRLISNRMRGGWIPFWSSVGGGEGSWWSRGGKKSCGNISVHFLCLIKLLVIIPWICVKHSRFLRDFTDASFETHTKQTDDPCLINEQTEAQKVPCPEVCGL